VTFFFLISPAKACQFAYVLYWRFIGVLYWRFIGAIYWRLLAFPFIGVSG
jgi:hypothetical protein